MLPVWTHRPVIFDYERGNTSNGDFQQSEVLVPMRIFLEVPVPMRIFLALSALLSDFCPGRLAGGLGMATHLTVQTETELFGIHCGK